MRSGSVRRVKGLTSMEKVMIETCAKLQALSPHGYLSEKGCRPTLATHRWMAWLWSFDYALTLEYANELRVQEQP